MVRTVSHYEILEEIAEGGMGIVYKARDTRLDRLVALKFLPSECGNTTERFQRFLHEARAISRLNHPHIATIYDIDDDGDRFMAFEYLSGGTLRSLVDRQNGQKLQPAAILRYAIQIGEALAHAHRHGIVHRDIKTDNVLLTEDGIAKLTDFGVARITGREDPSGEHVTVGTAAYTSPEQATGQPSDHRSDIFSFGVVLFEMAAGQVPFPGEREEVILYDIVNTPAPPLTDFRTDLPERFVRIVERSLQKDPAGRYQAMDDALADLRAVERELFPIPAYVARPLPKEATIAVLPFVDMSPSRDQEYFCDGIAEEIINVLTAVKGIRVVSRTSSFQFKGRSTDVREIGEKLNVQTVLEGSVRKAGDFLRITVQQIDVRDGYHIWSERYDRKLDDVFAIQDEISQKIVENLRAKLLPGEVPRVGARRASNVEAYNLYLKGRFHLNQRSKEGLLASLEEFEKACCEDCSFALPFAGLAEAQLLAAAQGVAGPDQRGEMLAKARKAAQEAIRQDDSCAEAHVALAMIYARADWDWDAAEEEFKKAIALNDGLALAHHQYAMYLAMRQRPKEAVREIYRALELDPLSPLINSAVGRVLYFARRYDESIEQLRRTLDLYPTLGNVYFDLGVTLARLGRFDECRELMDRFAALLPEDERPRIIKGWIDAASGETEKAQALLKELEEGEANPVATAVLCTGLGENDRALSALEKALEERDLTIQYIGVEAAFDSLRSEPRMAALLSKMGLTEQPAEEFSPAQRGSLVK